jgi:hypothetical protein
MEDRGKATDRHGRTWTAKVVSKGEAEVEDLRIWFEEMSPEQRVNAVKDCLLSSLKAKGLSEIPPIQPVARVIKPPRR